MTAPPDVKKVALAWNAVQHLAAVAGFVTLALADKISGEMAGGGILIAIGILEAPAILGRGPAGTINPAMYLIALGKALLHVKGGPHA